MNIGRMDRRITLKTPTLTKNAIGESLKTYSTLDVVWASIKFPSGMAMNEGEEAGIEKAIKPVEFSIRFRTDVDETVNVYYQSKTYEVKRVVEIGRRDGLRLITEVRI